MTQSGFEASGTQGTVVYTHPTYCNIGSLAGVEQGSVCEVDKQTAHLLRHIDVPQGL